MNTIRYYSPTLDDSRVPTLGSRDGIAFSVDSICLYVADASKGIQPRAMTLVGVPIIPISLSDDGIHSPAYFDVVLWLMPRRGNNDYRFDVRLVELELDDGSKASARVAQLSRFRTNLEKERVYMFTPDLVERISYPEHWGPKPLGDFTEPIELWDWTRVTLRFEKSAPSKKPSRLYIRGVLRGGSAQEVPSVSFAFVSDTRGAFPGRFADGTWIGDWPDKACRSLQGGLRNAP